jgi:uncharacterized surface protein with fasciclin (FAS1) repeats
MKSPSRIPQFAATLLLLALPQAQAATLAETLKSQPDLSTLQKAIDTAGVGNALAAAPSITVLAPSNAAFAALPAGTLDALLAPEGKAQLEALLNRHVVGTAHDVNSLKLRRSVTTLAGNEVRPALVRGKLRLNGEVRVSARAIRIDNGYVLVIDQVLVP